MKRLQLNPATARYRDYRSHKQRHRCMVCLSRMGTGRHVEVFGEGRAHTKCYMKALEALKRIEGYQHQEEKGQIIKAYVNGVVCEY